MHFDIDEGDFWELHEFVNRANRHYPTQQQFRDGFQALKEGLRLNIGIEKRNAESRAQDINRQIRDLEAERDRLTQPYRDRIEQYQRQIDSLPNAGMQFDTFKQEFKAAQEKEMQRLLGLKKEQWTILWNTALQLGRKPGMNEDEEWLAVFNIMITMLQPFVREERR